MRHPTYHLRPNKAVDRLALIEAIRRLEKLGNISEYTYYGLGGPYLEDFRLLYEFCPGLKMVSIEKNQETFKRQEFHRPCCEDQLTLVNDRLKPFLALYAPSDERSIFWLDYTGMAYGHFEDFISLLRKVAESSMVKITLRCEPRDYLGDSSKQRQEKVHRFREMFGAVMPDASAEPPRLRHDLACLFQNMLQIAAEKALSSSKPHMFQPVSSFHYSDSSGILTLTGVVCKEEGAHDVQEAFKDWQFANLDWSEPMEIDVPVLTTKERLHLQEHLPCNRDAGRTLREALGYHIDTDSESTEIKLEHYAQFHRQLPYFMKAIP